MKWIPLSLLLTVLLAACSPAIRSTTSQAVPTDGPLRLHPANPHYFLYKGQPLALITSAEHYGALLNLDFDYTTYLNTLAADGMNYTRIFTGTYFEIPGESFGIQSNTLAPQPDRVITPWNQVASAAGNKQYDLTSWNSAYFERLKDFLRLADQLDIVVEVTLFSSIYREAHWNINPQNPANNVNLEEAIPYREAQTINNGPLYQYQADFVKKMVRELNDFDNFFFEIQNEPWADNAVAVYNIVNKEELRSNDWTFKADFASEASLAWQDKLVDIVAQEEQNLGKQHLIAQNYTNFRAPIPTVSDNISIINFHYAWPDAVNWNYHYDRVIGFDESGFAGSDDQVYRRQAWQFMLSGGGLFNNLDYSFYVGQEDGRGKNEAPGGGSTALRRELKILSDFLHALPLPELTPDLTSVKKAPGLIPFVLSNRQDHYAIFVRSVGTSQSRLELQVPDGAYRVQYLDTTSGAYAGSARLESKSGRLILDLSLPKGELAIRIDRD